MRHGEAEEARGQGDHARRLSRRGRADAERVGRMLALRQFRPTRLYVSDAARTQETADAVVAVLGDSVLRQADASLYLTGLEELAALFQRGLNSAEPQVLVIGHNPGFSKAISTLTGTWTDLGTAEAVWLSVEAADWQEALQLQGAWTIDATFTP